LIGSRQAALSVAVAPEPMTTMRLPIRVGFMAVPVGAMAVRRLP
jgi:hypothetical protein